MKSDLHISMTLATGLQDRKHIRQCFQLGYISFLVFFFIFCHFDWICCGGFFDWICCGGTEGVCMCVCCVFCVCLCVRVCVCMWKRCCSNGWNDFNEVFYKWSDRYLRGPLFSDFEIWKLMTPWWPFCVFFIRALSRSQFLFDFFKL